MWEASDKDAIHEMNMTSRADMELRETLSFVSMIQDPTRLRRFVSFFVYNRQQMNLRGIRDRARVMEPCAIRLFDENPEAMDHVYHRKLHRYSEHT